MTASDWLYLLNTASTLYMCGLIWFVQIVHYPLLANVPAADAPGYAQAHQRRTAWVVIPAMVIEAITAGLLCIWPPAGFPRWASVLAAVGVVVIWISTFSLQVPRHARLARSFDPQAQRELVRTNWLRTASWSLRALLLLAFFSSVFDGD